MERGGRTNNNEEVHFTHGGIKVSLGSDEVNRREKRKPTKKFNRKKGKKRGFTASVQEHGVGEVRGGELWGI